MKKQLIAVLTIVFAMCLAITVYALNSSTNVSAKPAADCCGKKDSCPKKDACPMKNKQANGEKMSCCDKPDCCCKGGDSCPMKKDGQKMEGKDCCCKGDSCPMKKDGDKQTSRNDVKDVTVSSHSVN